MDYYERFSDDLKLRSYAKRSRQTYLRTVRQLQNFCCKSLEEITEEETREYWLYCKKELKWRQATLRISYSGIKHFFTYTIKRDWPVLSEVKFERDHTLPVVISVDEVRTVLHALQPGQNRTFFEIVYSLGLRLTEALHPVARENQKIVYNALLNSAAAALRTLEADKRFVGCNLAGFFGVLHTWGRQIQYHPHVHFIVPGGGLSKKRDQWIPANGSFLVHVRALSKIFRAKVQDALAKAKLLHQIPKEVWKQEWVVHCQSVGDGRAAMKYLGAYVFRVAISNARIEHYDGDNVTVKFRKVGSNRWRHMKLSAFEFLRRYLQHVLPHGFMKIRHFGFLSPNCNTTIQKIRELICVLYELLRNQKPKIKPSVKSKPLCCPACKAIMCWVKFISAYSLGYSP